MFARHERNNAHFWGSPVNSFQPIIQKHHFRRIILILTFWGYYLKDARKTSVGDIC